MPAFLADECFSGLILRTLREAGFDIARSAETHPAASDIDVLALGFQQNRFVLTEDTDFGDLIVRLGLPTRGVVRVDLKSLGREARARRTLEALTQLGEDVCNALVLIEPSRTRARKLL